jgi:hypothetical protein
VAAEELRVARETLLLLQPETLLLLQPETLLLLQPEKLLLLQPETLLLLQPAPHAPSRAAVRAGGRRGGGGARLVAVRNDCEAEAPQAARRKEPCAGPRR